MLPPLGECQESARFILSGMCPVCTTPVRGAYPRRSKWPKCPATSIDADQMRFSTCVRDLWKSW